MKARNIAALIQEYRLPHGNEAELQENIERLFITHNIEHKREFRLNEKDRLDFIVGSIAIEVKTAGGCADVIRQLHRYAQHESITELVLVTTKASHLRVPERLNEKPVWTASLLGAAF